MMGVWGLIGVDAETRKKRDDILVSISSMLIAAEGSLIKAKEMRITEKHPAGEPNPFIAAINMGMARGMLNVHRMISNSAIPEKHQEKLKADLDKRVAALLEPYAKEFGYTLRQLSLEEAFMNGILDRHASQMSEAKEAHAKNSANGVTPDTLALAGGIDRAYEISNRILNKGVPDMQMRITLLLDSRELIMLLGRKGHINKFEHPVH